MIQEYDCISLTEDLPALGLRKGDVGTAVMVYNEGEAYEVEFITSEGATIALVTLLAAQIRLISKEEETRN
jgi:hypothetical protein